MAVVFDGHQNDDVRRISLYNGDIHVSQPTTATEDFCAFTRDLVREAFGDLDPEMAQDHLPVASYAEVLAVLKPNFIHHPHSKEFIRDILAERGCDLEATYIDVPRLRTSTSGGYLTTGIAYAWHPHRDTWYSAPMHQLNFWMPVYPVSADNAMAFHTKYFRTTIPNSSHDYNYYEWNSKHRASAASNIKAEVRPLPGPTVELDISDPLVLLTPVGGLIEFSGQQLHSSVPNHSGRTRYSIDFRTVHIGDIESGRCATNVDAHCTGSSIRDFIRASDFAPLPSRIVEQFIDGTEDRGELVYSANATGSTPR